MESYRQRSSNLGLDLNLSPAPLPEPQLESELEAKLTDISVENKRLNDMLDMFINGDRYTTLQKRKIDNCLYPIAEQQTVASSIKKRKISDSITITLDGTGNERIDNAFESCKRFQQEIKPNIRTVIMRTDPADSSLVVKDGYQWRKYGQKVTRDNPSPRAYFKCSFAPSCPVKKKVQRRAADKSVIVAIYEGEHNHDYPCTDFGDDLLRSCYIANKNAGSSIMRQQVEKSSEIQNQELQTSIAKQMTNSLIKDTNFTTALVNAISEKILGTFTDVCL